MVRLNSIRPSVSCYQVCFWLQILFGKASIVYLRKPTLELLWEPVEVYVKRSSGTYNCYRVCNLVQPKRILFQKIPIQL